MAKVFAVRKNLIARRPAELSLAECVSWNGSNISWGCAGAPMGRWSRSFGWGILLFSCVARGQQYKVLIEQGHYLRARVQVENALKSDPRDQDALIAKSAIEMVFNHLDAAVDAAQNAVAAGDNNAAAHAQLAEAIGWRLASSSVSMVQKVASAWPFHRELNRALELDPNNVEALSYKAEYYWYVPAILGGRRRRRRSMRTRWYCWTR